MANAIAPAKPDHSRVNITDVGLRDDGALLCVFADLTGEPYVNASGTSKVLAHLNWTEIVHPELGRMFVTFTVRQDTPDYGAAKDAARAARLALRAFRRGK